MKRKVTRRKNNRKTTNKSSLAKIRIIILLLVVGFLFVFLKNSSVFTNFFNRPLKGALDDTMFATSWNKRNYTQIRAEDSIYGFPPALLSDMNRIRNNNLVSFRCTDRIVHEIDGYYFREIYTHAVTRKVTDKKILDRLDELHNDAQRPFELLTARVCETENQDILLEYSLAVPIYNHPDISKDATAYLAYFDKDATEFESVELMSRQSWPYPGCQLPLHITKDKKVLYACEIASADKYQVEYGTVDFATKTKEKDATCEYDYSDKPAKICY